jgi:hypothetical protein
MSAYTVQFDGQIRVVDAPGFTEAIAAWGDAMQIEWGDDYDGTEQPESVALIDDQPVIRYVGMDGLADGVGCGLERVRRVMCQDDACEQIVPGDLRELVGEIDRLRERLGRAERGDDQVLRERDAANDALSRAYLLVVGKELEWSNYFGHKDALSDIEDAMIDLRKPPGNNGQDGDQPVEFCDVCQHAMHLHNPDGSCGCGMDCKTIRGEKEESTSDD